MAKLKGRDVSVSIEIDGGGKELLALSRDADVDVSCDLAEFTSPLSGRAKRNRAGRYSWTVNIGTLIEASNQPARLLELLKSGAALTLTMDVDLLNDAGYKCVAQGDAVVTRWNFGAPLQGLATFSVSFAGDGELRLVTKRNPTPGPRP
jgi:predicted secreted protein